MQSQKRQNYLGSLPRQTIQYHSNPSLCPKHWRWRSWSWTVLWEPTRPSRTNTQKRCPFHHRGLECTYSSPQDKSEKLVTATTNWRFLLLFFFSESKRPSGRGQNNEGPGPVSRRQSGLPELLFANRWAHHRMQWLFCSTHEAEGEEVGSTEQLLPPW